MDAAHLAERAGIEHWHASADDAARAHVVAGLRSSGHVVGYAGDVARPGADVTLGTSVEAGLRLDDLDVRRVARALDLCRSAVGMRRRLRRASWVVAPLLVVVTLVLA